MAETSRPWPGTTIGDAGPYSAEDWFDVWGAISRSGVDFGRSADYGIGVFYALGNALEPAVNGTDIDVDTGGSLVDGLYHENTATVSVPIPAAGVGLNRIDYIVVRKNYQQAVTYTPGGGAPTVPPRTARITVIRGTEAVGPVAPSLTQDTTRTTYWDIPLATVQVSAAGVLSNFTDLREFVDAETKQILISANRSENATDGTDPLTFSYIGLIMLDNKACRLEGEWIVPPDFIGSCTVSLIVRPNATGNYYGDCYYYYGLDGEDFDNTQNGTINTAVAVTDGQNNVILTTSIAGLTINDIVTVEAARTATNVLDTVNANVYFAGFLITYFGWKK